MQTIETATIVAATLNVQALTTSVPNDLRLKCVKSFKEGHKQILVTLTSVARGVDHFPAIAINFDVPVDPKEFMYRGARGAILGAQKGVTWSFIGSEEKEKIQNLEWVFQLKVKYF